MEGLTYKARRYGLLQSNSVNSPLYGPASSYKSLSLNPKQSGDLGGSVFSWFSVFAGLSDSFFLIGFRAFLGLVFFVTFGLPCVVFLRDRISMVFVVSDSGFETLGGSFLLRKLRVHDLTSIVCY